jgi:hypothetical protein
MSSGWGLVIGDWGLGRVCCCAVQCFAMVGGDEMMAFTLKKLIPNHQTQPNHQSPITNHLTQR